MEVRGSAISREIAAVYIKDDSRIEIRIRLPASYPLEDCQVECTSKAGVAEGKCTRWVLQIIQLLATQDGSVVDAILFL